MLGKQRKNNATDQQFMDAAWKNMAEILDQEMPVETKERRIGWMSIAALLVMGFVGGISVMWGLQKHESAPMASDHKINTTTTSEPNIVSTPIVDKNEIIANVSQQKETQTLTSNTSAYNSKSRLHNNTTTTKSNNTNGNSMVTLTNVEQVPTKSIVETEIYIAQVDLVENDVVDNTSTIAAPTSISMENSVLSASAIATDLAMPLSDLPTLGLATLPMVNTNFGIDNDIDLPKNKKWRTGIYGGAIVAGKTGNGLEAAFRVERKLGAKWAVETGLGFRATQLAILSENQSPENLDFEDNDPSLITSGDTLERSIVEIASRVNADEPNYQLTVPLSFVYRPTGKLRLALGMSWAYRLNTLKDASSFDNFNGAFAENADLDQNSFSDRINDIRLNFGVGYHLNPRTAIELAFSEALSDNSNSFGDPSSLFAKSEDDLPSRFLQIGLIHYFGK